MPVVIVFTLNTIPHLPVVIDVVLFSIAYYKFYTSSLSVFLNNTKYLNIVFYQIYKLFGRNVFVIRIIIIALCFIKASVFDIYIYI